MKALKFIFALFFLFGISSCKKTENTSAKVTVFDKTTQMGVSNMKVVLTEIYNTSSLGSANYTFNVLKTGYTDANGKYDFGEFVTPKKGKYTYSVDTDWANPNGSSNIQKGESNDIILKNVYMCDVIIKFLPPPPYNAGDSLSFNIISASYPNNHWTITNYNYSYFPSVGISSGYSFINIDKYKSGIYTNIKDTVFYDPKSSNEYDLYW
ncbi:MAG: hypothetical protein A3F72_09190 [Bacteroidetes bacterium RIFCSPLOWO2_12_FULL_35_15]|nr:MAG: hypothetical protein A3F72_09190 [Bacteroidetes bacterium RIFCSPLOWO2_12_FULL_35_15]